MTEPKIPAQSPHVLEMEPGTYAWCSCGKSNKHPFCDGSHKGSDLRPVVTQIAEKKTVAWCACKKTQGAPFCDGSHKKS